MGAKIKRICLSRGFVSLFIQGARFECIRGLPSDAKIRSLYYEPERDRLTLVVESSSFPDVKEGDVIPEFVPLFKDIGEKA